MSLIWNTIMMMMIEGKRIIDLLMIIYKLIFPLVNNIIIELMYELIFDEGKGDC